jgi:hypothetical protein
MIEHGINFDEASKEWRKNKESIGNGAFKYIQVYTPNIIKIQCYCCFRYFRESLKPIKICSTCNISVCKKYCMSGHNICINCTMLS